MIDKIDVLNDCSSSNVIIAAFMTEFCFNNRTFFILQSL